MQAGTLCKKPKFRYTKMNRYFLLLCLFLGLAPSSLLAGKGYKFNFFIGAEANVVSADGRRKVIFPHYLTKPYLGFDVNNSLTFQISLFRADYFEDVGQREDGLDTSPRETFYSYTGFEFKGQVYPTDGEKRLFKNFSNEYFLLPYFSLGFGLLPSVVQRDPEFPDVKDDVVQSYSGYQDVGLLLIYPNSSLRSKFAFFAQQHVAPSGNGSFPLSKFTFLDVGLSASLEYFFHFTSSRDEIGFVNVVSEVNFLQDRQKSIEEKVVSANTSEDSVFEDSRKLSIPQQNVKSVNDVQVFFQEQSTALEFFSIRDLVKMNQKFDNKQKIIALIYEQGLLLGAPRSPLQQNRLEVLRRVLEDMGIQNEQIIVNNSELPKEESSISQIRFGDSSIVRFFQLDRLQTFTLGAGQSRVDAEEQKKDQEIALFDPSGVNAALDEADGSEAFVFQAEELGFLLRGNYLPIETENQRLAIGSSSSATQLNGLEGFADEFENGQLGEDFFVALPEAAGRSSNKPGNRRLLERFFLLAVFQLISPNCHRYSHDKHYC